MSDIIAKLKARVAASTIRRDGIYAIVGGPPCACGSCQASEAQEILAVYNEALDTLEELTGIVVGHVKDGDKLDSLTTQPACAVLAKAGRR